MNGTFDSGISTSDLELNGSHSFGTSASCESVEIEWIGCIVVLKRDHTPTILVNRGETIFSGRLLGRRRIRYTLAINYALNAF